MSKESRTLRKMFSIRFFFFFSKKDKKITKIKGITLLLLNMLSSK